MKKIFNIIAITLWAICVGIGSVWIADYSTRPGQTGISLTHLPFKFGGEDQMPLPKLFVFLHPHCPCSRATLTELNKLVERNLGAFEVNIFFYQPSDQSAEWAKTELWQKAAAISNANVSAISESELRNFGAITSGQTLFYDPRGNLVFSGGITISRGHEGDSLGIEIIEKYLHGQQIAFTETPVFGCILTTSEQLTNF